MPTCSVGPMKNVYFIGLPLLLASCASQNAGLNKTSESPLGGRAWHTNSGMLAGEYQTDAEKLMKDFCAPAKPFEKSVTESPKADLIGKAAIRFIDFECQSEIP